MQGDDNSPGSRREMEREKTRKRKQFERTQKSRTGGGWNASRSQRSEMVGLSGFIFRTSSHQRNLKQGSGGHSVHRCLSEPFATRSSLHEPTVHGGCSRCACARHIFFIDPWWFSTACVLRSTYSRGLGAGNTCWLVLVLIGPPKTRFAVGIIMRFRH